MLGTFGRASIAHCWHRVDSDGSMNAEDHRLRFARQISNTKRPHLTFDPHVGNIYDVAHVVLPECESLFAGRGLGRQRLSSHRKTRALSETEHRGDGSGGIVSSCFPSFHPAAVR